MTREGQIKPEMYVGDVLKAHPVLRDRIRALFGAECLQCRSNRFESIAYTAWHKGLDPVKVCRELNAALHGK